MDIVDFFKKIQNFLSPPKAFSWETLILLSLFSCIMSYLATNDVRNFIATFGWIFLIWGVAWGTSQKRLSIGGVSLSPWITGALVTIFIFGSWSDGIPPLALIYWPPVSAVIAALPKFFDQGLRVRIPPPHSRQNLIILFTSHVLISCWFQFYFVVQNWLDQYPTLLADDFSKSAFIVKLESQPPVIPRGALVLNLMETPILQDLNNKPWSEVERWLLEHKKHRETLRQQVQKQIPNTREDLWWEFDSNVSTSASGYNLQLQATWQGPRSQPENYIIEKSCEINQVYRQLDTDTDATVKPPDAKRVLTGVGEVKCTSASQRRWVKSQ